MSVQTTLFTNELVALVCFGADGKPIQCSAVDYDVSDSAVRSAVRMFISSVSIAEALLRPSKGDDSKWNEVFNADGVQKPTTVSLDGGGIFVAIRLEESVWLGFIINKFVTYDNDLVDALVPALMDAARHLVESRTLEKEEGTGTHSPAFELWSAMCTSIIAAKHWNRGKPCTQVRRALVALANCRAHGHRNAHQSLAVVQEERSQLHQHLKSFGNRFRADVAAIGGEAPSVLFIFSPDLTVRYSDNMTVVQEQSVLWYFEHIANFGSRVSSSRHFFEGDGRMVRLWYKRQGFILYAHLCPKKVVSERDWTSTRGVAFDLLRVVESFRM